MRCLLLPGFACTASVWRMVVGATAGNRCEAIDWPADRLSDWEAPADFAGWLVGTGQVDSVDVLVGHSMGGLVAIEAASRHPVRGVVLVETFLHAPPPAFQNLVHPDAPAGVNEEVHAMLASEAKRYSTALKAGLRSGAFVADRTWPEGVPVLAVYGRRDDSMTPAVVARELGIESEASHGPLSVALVPQSCHFPMLENPAAVTAILRQWMQRLEASEASPAGA